MSLKSIYIERDNRGGNAHINWTDPDNKEHTKINPTKLPPNKVVYY